MTGLSTRDGQNYKIVQIGEQCWMAENLNYEMDDSWCYKNQNSNCDKYGKLYTWEAAMDACPNGWHLPSDSEWSDLLDFIGRKAGKKLKSLSGWHNGGNGTNDYGFSALPGGYRSSNGYFSSMGYYAYFWSSTERGARNAWYRALRYGRDAVYRSFSSKEAGRSVRCLRDY